MIRRFGRREGIYSFIIPGVFYFVFSFAILYSMWPYFYYIKNESLIALGVFAIWRYGWQIINYARALVYSLYVYPRHKRRIQQLAEEQKFPQHIYFVIPSFKEENWVSVETFQSIFSNIAQIPSSATLIVATGSDREDVLIASVHKAHPVREKVELVLQRQSQGKRVAMGHALRAVARRFKDEPNSVTVFMDGDTFLESFTLEKTLPFFSAYSKLGALTTNETAFINSYSQWYKDWFNLKFGQRHVLFQSHSLSNKVLTLTGRFSLLRTSIVVEEAFIQQVENDVLTHWLHGKFRFLMGDDKSTWFYVLKHEWNMLYIPDVTCCSLESRDANFFTVSMALPYRWHGNTLRNNSRALELGWRKTGLFIWVAILDQKISMWTSLVGITGAIVLSIAKSYIYLAFYIAWVFLVRIVQMAVIAFRGHPVSLITIPLMLYNQWVGSIIKIRVFFNLSDQTWSKGGSVQTSRNQRAMIKHPLVKFMPKFLLLKSYAIFIFCVVLAQGALSLPGPDILFPASNKSVTHAAMYGVVANDQHDDALALQTIINRLPEGRDHLVRLPPGRLDFMRPVVIDKSLIVIAGDEQQPTRIVSHLQTADKAVILIRGRGPDQPGYKLGSPLLPTAKVISIRDAQGIVAGDFLLFKQPNDTTFFDHIGSDRWRRKYPFLRQAIARVESVTGDLIALEQPTGLALSGQDSEVYRVQPVTGVTIRDLAIEQLVPGANVVDTHGVYENLFPQYAVDAIRLEWSADCRLNNVTLDASGRHPLVFENTYGCTARHLSINGSWNKGKKGNGYVKLSRAYYNELADSVVQNIRHVTLQWSSAFNQIHRLKTGVDINFHGGYSHDNTITDVIFDLAPSHPWPSVYRTPDNASWAPPDGTNNIIR